MKITNKLHFSGHSDDTVELVDDENGLEEFDCWNKPFFAKVIDKEGNGLSVCGMYKGIWLFGIGQIAEDKELPDWPVSYTMAENGYSVVLTLDVPEGVTATATD